MNVVFDIIFSGRRSSFVYSPLNHLTYSVTFSNRVCGKTTVPIWVKPNATILRRWRLLFGFRLYAFIERFTFQVSTVVLAVLVCSAYAYAAAAEDVKSSSPTKSVADRSKRGLYAPFVGSPYAPAYAAPYAAPYTAPYAAPYVPPYAAPYVAPYAAPYVPPYAAPYTTSSYLSSYSAYPYGYASPYGFFWSSKINDRSLSKKPSQHVNLSEIERLLEYYLC